MFYQLLKQGKKITVQDKNGETGEGAKNGKLF